MTLHNLLRTLSALAMAMAPITASAALLPVSNGLILNLQANNIDGLNNGSLVDGVEVSFWFDAPNGADNVAANDASSAGATAFGAISQLTPNFVAGPVPSVKFTKRSGSTGDSLGFSGAIGIGTGNVDFTAFVVGDFNSTGIARIIHFGDVETGPTPGPASPDRKIVGIADNGFRYNGGRRSSTRVSPMRQAAATWRPTRKRPA